jgi:carboxypeptidase C (cathepsin A)
MNTALYAKHAAKYYSIPLYEAEKMAEEYEKAYVPDKDTGVQQLNHELKWLKKHGFNEAAQKARDFMIRFNIKEM